jgi:hypothetical protein
LLEKFKSEPSWRLFKWTLYFSIGFAVIWSFQQEPWVFKSNWLVQNSAFILLFISTLLLIIVFFWFVRVVVKYYSPDELINYFISKQSKSPLSVTYVSILSDLLIYHVLNKSPNHAQTLRPYFTSLFAEHKKNVESNTVFPDEYYSLVLRLTEELSERNSSSHIAIAFETIGSQWFLGGLRNSAPSDRTYTAMWRGLLLSVRNERDDFVLYHWSTCHQYLFLGLPKIAQEYSNNTWKVTNQKEIDQRNAERERFFGFHYALRGYCLISNDIIV